MEDGVAAAGMERTRGSYNSWDATLFRLERYFDRIDFIAENTGFYLDPKKAIAKSAGANISEAVLFSQKIEAENRKSGEVLIAADKLFLSEALFAVNPLPDPEKKPHEVFSLGKLSDDKSKISMLRNYPENTDVVVKYVYENDKPYVDGGPEVTDPRYVSILVQHSLIKAPENPMASRRDDARMGYFEHQVTDLSSSDITPWKDVIRRFRLQKKFPDAALSEPVEPITFWLENTTPHELRPIITAAALRWNEAFEAAGFKNALEIKVQPDNAEWDAGDLRYNVIRWVSSPTTFYSGYGPSFIDPRSGEVLGADIMLEFSGLSRRVHWQDILGEGLQAEVTGSPMRCNLTSRVRAQWQYGLAALEAGEAETPERERMLEEFVYFLILHEIGHTLGLSHNFKSSYLHSLEDIFQPEITYKTGLTGSVMEYPTVAMAASTGIGNQYWSTRPGPYDRWAIEYGYSPAMADPLAEEARLEKILSRSTEPALAYANDADGMSEPGNGIDPRAMTMDMTNDPIAFSQHQLAQLESVVQRLSTKLARDGQSWQRLLNAYGLSLSRLRELTTPVSRFIGGVYVDRSLIGQEGAQNPLTPVSLQDQRRAMSLLEREVFAPDAFAAFNQFSGYLLAQRRGFDHHGSTEDPKLHDNALSIQKVILDQLLHPRVLARLIDTKVYGNQYTVDRFFGDLSHAIFAADLKTEVNTFRQNLQLEYVERLLAIVNQVDYDNISRSLALDRLEWIRAKIGRNKYGDAMTKAHRSHILYRIERGLDRHS